MTLTLAGRRDVGRINAAEAMACWRSLDHAPMRLLVHMALRSFDPPGTAQVDPFLYFDGWESQAIALGYHLPSAEATDTYSVERRETIHRQVKRIRTQLVRAGAIELLKLGSPGRPPMWLIRPHGGP